MNDSSQQQPAGPFHEFIEALWPTTLATDSELRRKKKWIVRSAQLGLLFMVGAAMAKTIVTEFHSISTGQILGVAVAGMLYISWSIFGVNGVIRSLLREEGASAQPYSKPEPPYGTVIYFGIQLGLALLICLLGSRRGNNPLVWVILLPPVAQSVFLLRGPGIAAVAGLSLTIFSSNIGWWREWKFVPEELPAFAFALLFTLAFTLLAVGAENARREVQRLAGELSEANQQLREYAVQADELATTRERNRLAREIHDSIGHCLTVVNVQVEVARALLDREPARARETMDNVQAFVQGGLRDIRHSVATLRVSPLDNQSLLDALQLMVKESNDSGLTVELNVAGIARPLSPPVELTLYRAVQEGLTNVRKHAPQAHVRLALDFGRPNLVSLHIHDDGPGASTGSGTACGFGLLGLRERAQLLGGRIGIQSETGRGFTLEVEVPG